MRDLYIHEGGTHKPTEVVELPRPIARQVVAGGHGIPLEEIPAVDQPGDLDPDPEPGDVAGDHDGWGEVDPLIARGAEIARVGGELAEAGAFGGEPQPEFPALPEAPGPRKGRKGATP